MCYLLPRIFPLAWKHQLQLSNRDRGTFAKQLADLRHILTVRGFILLRPVSEDASTLRE